MGAEFIIIFIYLFINSPFRDILYLIDVKNEGPLYLPFLLTQIIVFNYLIYFIISILKFEFYIYKKISLSKKNGMVSPYNY